MEKIFEYGFYGQGTDFVERAVHDIEATTKEELRLKLRGSLLANLDEMISRIVEGRFQLQYVSSLGQRLDPDKYNRLQSLPKGFALLLFVTQVRWMEYITVYYRVPEGDEVNGEAAISGKFYEASGCGSYEAYTGKPNNFTRL